MTTGNGTFIEPSRPVRRTALTAMLVNGGTPRGLAVFQREDRSRTPHQLPPTGLSPVGIDAGIRPFSPGAEPLKVDIGFLGARRPALGPAAGAQREAEGHGEHTDADTFNYKCLWYPGETPNRGNSK
jgi:hypothetical protein